MALSPGDWAELACLWEVFARKAGNVHRERDFADLTYADFIASAQAIGPVFAAAGHQRVGQIILDAIRATRKVVTSNTNLGMVLLLAPLAAIPLTQTLQNGIGAVLADLDIEDSRHVYAAIRLAQPGGLGQAAQEDVAGEPTLPLVAAMSLAADRDLVVRQYANGFHEVLDIGVPVLRDGWQRFSNLEQAIQFTQLRLLARFPDSLIVRKRSLAEAQRAGRMADAVLQAGWPATQAGRNAWQKLDDWLRELGNARNPGTSADLIAACLFAALREGQIDIQGTGWPCLSVLAKTRRLGGPV